MRQRGGVLRQAVCCWLAAVLVVLSIVVLAAPATAHAALLSTDPDRGSQIPTLPGQIALTFSDQMNRPSTITVTAPDGSRIDEGDTTVDGQIVSRRVHDPDLAGLYRVDYRVISADGHPVTGSYKFSVTTGTPAHSEATSAPLTSERQWHWFFIGFGALVVVLALIVVYGLTRPRE